MIALTFQKAIQNPHSYISNPYANYYQLRPGVWNYHPGIDVLFQEGSIAHCPVKAVSWMQITYAQRCLVPGFEVWGNLIVGRCELPDHAMIYCRYAHVENILVKVGQVVYPGQHIADVGDAFGNYVYHLDFSISPTKVLALTPWDWPGGDLQRIYDNYIDPVSFVERHSKMATDYAALNAAMANAREAFDELEVQIKEFETEPEPEPEPIPDPVPVPATVVNALGANIRQFPTTTSLILVEVPVKTKLVVKDAGVSANGHAWMLVIEGPEKAINGYVAKDLLSFP